MIVGTIKYGEIGKYKQMIDYSHEIGFIYAHEIRTRQSLEIQRVIEKTPRHTQLDGLLSY